MQAITSFQTPSHSRSRCVIRGQTNQRSPKRHLPTLPILSYVPINTTRSLALDMPLMYNECKRTEPPNPTPQPPCELNKFYRDFVACANDGLPRSIVTNSSLSPHSIHHHHSRPQAHHSYSYSALADSSSWTVSRNSDCSSGID